MRARGGRTFIELEAQRELETLPAANFPSTALPAPALAENLPSNALPAPAPMESLSTTAPPAPAPMANLSTSALPAPAPRHIAILIDGSAGAGRNMPANTSLGEQLLNACKWRMIHEAELLIRGGVADLDYSDETGLTPLIVSCLFSELDHIAARLIAAGAALDKVDSMGRSALILACGLGSAASARRLLEAGAALNKINAVHKTAMGYAHARREDKAWAAIEVSMRVLGGRTFFELEKLRSRPNPGRDARGPERRRREEEEEGGGGGGG